MSIDQLLFSLAPVTALVGTKIFPMLLPNQSAYPSIAYRVKALSPHEQGVSVPGMTRMRLVLDSFAQDYATADSVRQALLSSLIGFTGPSGSDYIQSTHLVDANDNYEPEILLYRLSLEVQLLY